MSKAFLRNFEEQLDATRMLIEGPGKRVHILGVVVSGNHEMVDGMACRSVSQGTTRLEAQAILVALKREITRIEGILAGGKAGAV